MQYKIVNYAFNFVDTYIIYMIIIVLCSKNCYKIGTP